MGKFEGTTTGGPVGKGGTIKRSGASSVKPTHAMPKKSRRRAGVKSGIKSPHPMKSGGPIKRSGG